jgi:hypothetical protein
VLIALELFVECHLSCHAQFGPRRKEHILRVPRRIRRPQIEEVIIIIIISIIILQGNRPHNISMPNAGKRTVYKKT